MSGSSAKRHLRGSASIDTIIASTTAYVKVWRSGSFPNAGPGERLPPVSGLVASKQNVPAQRNLSLPSAPRASLLATGNLVVEGSTMMNRRHRPRRAAVLLALLVLAAIVTGVAASAATTVPPTPLTGRWDRANWGGDLLFVRPRGKVEIRDHGWYQARFKRVAAHRLSIRGIRSCSGTGTYRWGITDHGYQGLSSKYGYELAFKKIHDACKLRVNLLTAHSWWRNPPPRP